MSNKFVNEEKISDDEAYRMLCLYSTDQGARDAISARGWMKHTSYIWGQTAPIRALGVDAYIYRAGDYSFRLVTFNI